jgi:hypothetical protein
VLLDVCWRMLTYADVCWRALSYADICWRMLTYADVCWRMQTYADILVPHPTTPVHHSPLRALSLWRLPFFYLCSSSASSFLCSSLLRVCSVLVRFFSPSLSLFIYIRQHTSAYAQHSWKRTPRNYTRWENTSSTDCIRQHTSAYASIRQHTSAYVSITQ